MISTETNWLTLTLPTSTLRLWWELIVTTKPKLQKQISMTSTRMIATMRSMRLLVRSSRLLTYTRLTYSVSKVFLRSVVSIWLFRMANSSLFLVHQEVVRQLSSTLSVQSTSHPRVMCTSVDCVSSSRPQIRFLLLSVWISLDSSSRLSIWSAHSQLLRM